MKTLYKWCRIIVFVPLILVAAIISNRAPLGEGAGEGVPWIKWLPWGQRKRRRL